MSKSIENFFGQVLKELRNEAGLSQEKLALNSDLDRSFISLLERGLRVPTISTLFSISQNLKKTPSEIIKIVEQRYKNL